MQLLADKYLKGDRAIWTIVITLCIFSSVVALSASSNMAYRLTDGNAAPFWFKHVAILVMGMVLMVYLQHFKFKYFSRISQVGIWAAGALLLITLLAGENVNSAKRWIMGFQPSDLAKIVLILYVSRMLSIKQSKIKNFKEGVLPILVPIAAICILILPADFSTAFMLGTVCFVLMYIGGVAAKHLLAVLGVAVAAFMLLIAVNAISPGFLPRVETWKSRIFAYGNTDNASTKEENYQAQMAKMGVYNGGLISFKPGRGNIKNDLYSAQSDFVFASIIEEFGLLLGALPFIFLYLVFFFRSIRVVLKTDSSFGAYVSFGLSFLLVLQAFINMGVGVNLLPVTGQPLPLISMGGTSILFTCIAIGIILNVSKGIDTETSTKNTAKA